MLFQNTMLANIFGPNRDEITKEWRRIHKEELYGAHTLLFRLKNHEECDGQGMWHVWETG